MKTSKSLDCKAVKASGKCSLKTGSIGVKSYAKRTNMLNHKARGGDEELSADKENKHFLFKEPVRMCPKGLYQDTFVTEKKETLELHPTETLASSAKIKLQLFPINKETRIGLEKDGHNPHLELTLKGQKKISSVLKHLEKKWGSSSIAKGDPMLFPYNIIENLSNCRRWTINDSKTSAAAVYAAVGSPEVFRLRYGWFYIDEPMSYGIPPTPTPYEAGVQSGGEGGCNANLETLCDEQDKVEVTSEDYKAVDVGDAANEIVALKMDNASVNPLDNEPRVISNVQQPSLPWIDSLSNISIGALLSEASLQGGFSTLDPKSFGINADMQPSGTSPIIFDSLDAFIAAQINQPPAPRVSTEDLRTSILDAEETCHAFSLRKSSSPADVQTITRKDHSVACSQDVSSSSLNLPDTYKINDQDEFSQNPPSGKTQPDLLISSRPYDDERSLGLTGIKWNDSLGPFDLGLPAKKLVDGGDSVSIGGFVNEHLKRTS